ncbi:hypothetical protein BTO04_01465 [Polaribacter sp. SA4-10]|uniref:BLUF domain-containing protein n=1 Tax=Polaribacter sp. SA4-10 TaxID=754397 RepID=UPI000B3D083F|nr:BLUF domain-containing protein [Polaribacter sp. SA4-10]ARV05440.1 hypothetical protein BTO04_01465 [Polaribacter sp. SA4-10]
MMKLRRIIYTSKATKELSKRNLLDLLHEARAFNKMDNITGVLIYKQGCFLQVLEGKTKVIDNLIERLIRDSRHKNFKIIQDNFIKNRLFKDWKMGCADFDDPTLIFIPGISTDFSGLKVINELIIHLPEIAIFLQDKTH